MRADGDAVAEPAVVARRIGRRTGGLVNLRALIPASAVQRQRDAVHRKVAVAFDLLDESEVHARAFFAEGGDRKRADAVGLVHPEIHPAVIGIIIGPRHRQRAGIQVVQLVQAGRVRSGADAVDQVAVAVLLPAPVNLFRRLFEIGDRVAQLQPGIVRIDERIVLVAFAVEHAVDAGEAAFVDAAGAAVLHVDGKFQPRAR